jgi:hypothetical protein
MSFDSYGKGCPVSRAGFLFYDRYSYQLNFFEPLMSRGEKRIVKPLSRCSCNSSSSRSIIFIILFKTPMLLL